ncbi:hypothetical protein TL16_g00232 [Triparma laevis f. inornata]|uniref:Uncharacterized protein n=1 Tax=Triparma laevis f. inornata TaxID=1714386 RepID=A0A9W6ZDJ9_9STRA|nr:hypothetical protein TL16_g00232 [Triparma laevis f. inornata]
MSLPTKLGRSKTDDLPMYTANKSNKNKDPRAMNKVPLILLTLLATLTVYIVVFSSPSSSPPSASASASPPITLSLKSPTISATADEKLFLPILNSDVNTFDDLLARVSSDPGKYLVIEPHFGLGNRLRVLSGGLALAETEGRALIVAWPYDSHLSSYLQTIFPSPLPFHLYNSEFPPTPIPHTLYDCMDVTKTNVKHQKIEVNHVNKLVIIKSAYPLANPVADFKHSFGYLRRFVTTYAHPSIKEMTSFSTPYYGLHIRSVIIDGAIENKNMTELQTLRGYQSITTAYSTINQRKVSNVDNFVATINSIVEREVDAKFYLSSDSDSAYTTLSKRFGDRVFFVDRETKTDSKRDSESIMYALIDMINLGRSKVILASSGSSFSIVASAFGVVEGHKTVVKTVGRDFGRSLCNLYNVEYGKLGDLNLDRAGAMVVANTGSEKDNGFTVAEMRDYERGIFEYVKELGDLNLDRAGAMVVANTGSEKDNGFTVAEMRDYERGIFEYVKELFSYAYPDTGFADAYFFERYGSDSVDDEFGVKSVYVPFPWGVIEEGEGAIKLQTFAKWFLDYRVVKYPHFTVMQRMSPGFVAQKLADINAPPIPFGDWVVFDDIGVKMRVEEFRGYVEGKEWRVVDGVRVRYKIQRGRKWIKNGVVRGFNSENGKYIIEGVGEVAMVKPEDRVNGFVDDVDRVWLPYRDVGLRWDKLAVVVGMRELKDLEGLLEGKNWDEMRDYGAGARNLFTKEGMYEYVVSVMRRTEGFANFAMAEDCTKLAREKKDAGYVGGGWWRADGWDKPSWL